MKPEATYEDDRYSFHWAEPGVEIVVERFMEARNDIQTEATIRSSHPSKGGLIFGPGHLNLLSASSKDTVRRACERRIKDDEHDWDGMIAVACTLAAQHYRLGRPVVDLREVEPNNAPRFLVRPLVLLNSVSMIYGHGDSGKSVLAAAIGAAVGSGSAIADLIPEAPGTVYVLDWEDEADVWAERIRAICVAHEIEPPAIYYERMEASLIETWRDVRKKIAQVGAVLVIIDSAGMAAGGDPSDASLMIRTLIACRKLGVSVLVIHHLPKDAKDKSNPYGSVYSSLEVRLSHLVESAQRDDELVMSLTNYKGNRTGKIARSGYGMRFSGTDDALAEIELRPLDPSKIPEFRSETASQWEQMKTLMLQERRGILVSEFAEALETTPGRVANLLSKHKDDVLNQATRGEEGRYVLRAREYSDTP